MFTGSYKLNTYIGDCVFLNQKLSKVEESEFKIDGGEIKIVAKIRLVDKGDC